MTAPTTVTITGTYYNQDGTLAAGKVVFTPTDPRFKNNSNAIDVEPVTATLNGSGAISQVLINATTEVNGGYIVQEQLSTPSNAVPANGANPSYTLAGTSSVDLSSV